MDLLGWYDYFPLRNTYNKFEQNTSVRKGQVSKNPTKVKQQTRHRSLREAFLEEGTDSQGKGHGVEEQGAQDEKGNI